MDRPVADMAGVAQRVMMDEGIEITETSSRDSGAKRALEGTKGDHYARSLLAKTIA